MTTCCDRLEIGCGCMGLNPTRTYIRAVVVRKRCGIFLSCYRHHKRDLPFARRTLTNLLKEVELSHRRKALRMTRQNPSTSIFYIGSVHEVLN